MAVIFFGFMGVIQFSTEKMAGTDGYFHLKVARLVWERGPLRGSFPWMAHTILENDFIDHHVVLHLLQAPFTAGGSLQWAAKASAAFYGALALIAFYLLLKKLDIAYAELWALALAGSSYPFLYRMSMPRAQAMGVILFCLFIGVWFHRNSWALFFAVLVFTWSYQLCLLLVPMACLLSFADYVIDRKTPWPSLGATAAGLGLGHVVNPYFPINLYFLYLHVGIMAVNDANLRAGTEWRPYGSWFIAASAWPTWLALFVVIALAFFIRRQHGTARTAGLFLVMSMFFLLLVKNRRWMEYWPPFCILFTASAVDDYIRGKWQCVPRLRWWLATPLLVCLGLLMYSHGCQTVKDIDRCSDWTRYRGAAQWLADHTKPMDLVYTTDWDDLPELFFHNHRNRYMVALDPHFMYLHDKDLYHLWDRINRGLVIRPSEFIERSFGARYVFTDRYHRSFKRQARKDDHLHRVYHDRYCSIYRVGDDPRPSLRRMQEAELLPIHGSSGKPTSTLNLREAFGVDCSNHQVLLYRAGTVADWAEFTFHVATEGPYHLRVHHVMAPDYGTVALTLDGRHLGVTYDCYSPYVAIRSPQLPGVFELESGAHRLRLTVVDRNTAARGHSFALDAIELLPRD